MVELKYNRTTKKYYKLIQVILDIKFLEKCYFRIKLNPSNLASLIYGEVFHGINLKWFQKISNEIKNGTYQIKPSQVVYIKNNNKEKRGLAINSFKDKVITEGFRGILLTIYEPLFSNSLYGFNQAKAVHFALKSLKSWKDISWFICLKIEKCFDIIHKNKLINILQQKISDHRFFDLINQFFNAKKFEVFINRFSSIESALQGNVLSPILLNIYLQELDEFVESFIFEFNNCNKKRRNQECRGFIESQKLKNKTPLKKNKRLKCVEKKKICNSELRKLYSLRVKYIRYANNCIIGISGYKNVAREIMAKTKFFLITELQLNLFEEKRSLFNLIHWQPFFLSFFFKKSPKIFNSIYFSKISRKTFSVF